ncbi:HpcH/HpaI aldolase family protein [Thermoactinospora rubra]|uniref:HpcH/HpaI aldolase family protein n=1 Tax=Thermoactinospora rubra TaxID=1088767 RepID=UPI000A11B450|nr:aldolase/citrate lyase family protein [Thermoactinospora rubra]
MDAAELAGKIRGGDKCVGYWVMLDAPVAAERIAALGYDYVVLDGQHGFIGYEGILAGLTAIEGARGAVGLVRVEACHPTPIGRALDAGAGGVIVPLVDTAGDAAVAVAAGRFPPQGRRSYGPMRGAARPAEVNERTLVIAMIETPEGLANVAEICATPGLDGVYIGPSDLSMALGGAYPGDPAIERDFEEALERVRQAAAKAGIAAGIHTPRGEVAARRLAEGFTFATVSGDLSHLEQAAAAHLKAARGISP